jgi:outer membrane protein OmpA-like peptidoglycan-associated protein
MGSASGVGTGTATGPATCEPGVAEAEKIAFLATPIYGPQDVAHAISVGSGSGIGGFSATYIPGVSLLLIQVTGKVQFTDAVAGNHPSFTTSHSDLSNLVTYLNSLPAETANQVLSYFQWDDTSKQENLALFNERLSGSADIWQNTGLSFVVNDPEWCDVTAQPMFSLAVGEEGAAGAGEHLQVTVYKEPTDAERGEIDALLTAAHTAIPTGTDLGIRASAGSNIGANAPGAASGGLDENPLQNEMAISSADLTAANDPDERGGNNFLKKSIMFANNADTLSSAQVSDIQGWIVTYNNGDTIAANNAITLRGFASAAGSAAYNQALVERRIASVQAAIIGAGVSAGRITMDNRGDAESETDAVGSDSASQSNERRVEIRIGSGERQNTVAHEFGHVFGLSDEYTEGSRTPGMNAWHNSTATAAGVTAGAQIEENDNIISVGNTVRPQHYATFAFALNQITSVNLGSRQWHVSE